MSFSRIVLFFAALAAASFMSPDESSARPRGGTHLYVLMGLGDNSPGLAEFAARMEQHGIPTTVLSHAGWQGAAADAIEQYKAGRLRSIEIVGHSLGGDAAMDMAAELGSANVPVQLVVTLDPVSSPSFSSNVRRAVNLIPRSGEDHFTMIAARERDIAGYVLSAR